MNNFKEKCNRYLELPKLIRRYSFDEKMLMCFAKSRDSYRYLRMRDVQKLRSNVLPWTLDTFVMLAVACGESFHRDFSGKQGVRTFNRICNDIWEAKYIETSNRDVKYMLQQISLNQFAYQQDSMIILYRYYRLFSFQNNEINLKQIFFDKFHEDYYEFLKLGHFIDIFLFTDLPFNNDIWKRLCSYNANIMYSLVIEYDDYKDALSQVAKTAQDYLCCVSPSMKYPFIRRDNFVYFPLPHMFLFSVSSSLLYRLIDCNQELSDKIGKNVLESYVFELIRDSNAYDSVSGEVRYNKNHSNASSPDVMAIRNDSVILLEVKKLSPNNRLRLEDMEAVKNDQHKIAEHIIQLYKQCCAFDEYNPFQNKDISRDCIWGVVIHFENHFMYSDASYLDAFEQLKIEDELEREWIRNHIKIAGLYDIERHCLSGADLIKIIKEGNKKDSIQYDVFATSLEGEEFNNMKFLTFKSNLDEESCKLASTLIDS